MYVSLLILYLLVDILGLMIRVCSSLRDHRKKLPKVIKPIYTPSSSTKSSSCSHSSPTLLEPTLLLLALQAECMDGSLWL
jgi:hypothetical protein